MLGIIHENYEYIPLTSNHILQLHKMLYNRTGLEIGGKFKNVQNYISATDENGKSLTIFTPLAPWDTPDAVNKICGQFNKMIETNKVDPLILIPVFITIFFAFTHLLMEMDE